MSNGYSDKPIIDAKTFAAMVRQVGQWVIDRPDVKQCPIEEADIDFFDAFNEYLQSEAEQPLLLSDREELPADTMNAMRFFLDRKRLSESRNITNTGHDAKQRGNDPLRHQNLAMLYSALHAYRIEKDDDFVPDPEEMKLWRQDVRAIEGGDVERNVVETNHLDYDDNVLVIVPGMSSTHQRMDLIKPYFKHAEMMLGGKQIYNASSPNKTVIYSLSYPNTGSLEKYADMHWLNAAPNSHVKPMVKQWVDESLLPSLGLDGKHTPDLPNLKRKLRRVSFYSISYGSVIVMQIQNAMASRLKELGYSSHQIAEAMPLVYSLNNNPVSRIDAPLPDTGTFSSIYAASPGDLIASSYANYEDLVTEGEVPPTCSKINNHTLLYWRQSPAAGINLDVLEHGELGQDDESWQVPRGQLTLPMHHSDLMGANIREPLAHGAYRDHSAAPLHNTLRRAVAGEELPQDMTETFKPYHLVESEEIEQQRQAKRTHSAFEKN